MTLSGSPEVAVKVTYKATVNLGDKWVANGEYYCPLVITVNGDDINGLDYKTANDFATAVEAKINGYTKNYVANTNFGGDQAEEYKNDSLKVSWKWNFEATNFAKGNQTDEKDTILGNAAAEEAAYDPCKSPKALNFTKGAGGLCLNKKQYADGCLLPSCCFLLCRCCCFPRL